VWTTLVVDMSVIWCIVCLRIFSAHGTALCAFIVSVVSVYSRSIMHCSLQQVTGQKGALLLSRC
jgi:hypothetical protein